MSSSAEGYIKKVFTREGQGKRGPWALDNFLIADENGEDIGWFGNGFREDASVPPKAVEGDYISFDWEQDGKFQNIVKGTAVIKKDRAPAPAAAESGAAPAVPAAASKGSTQQNIHYQNSRTAAIEVVGMLLANDGLPITTNKAKAGQPKRYDEITAAVNKLTVQFYNDLESFRLFDSVADAGIVDTSADGELPEGEVTQVMEDGDEPL